MLGIHLRRFSDFCLVPVLTVIRSANQYGLGIKMLAIQEKSAETVKPNFLL